MENRLDPLFTMTEQDRELFARSVQTLLSSTFIIKQLDRERELYRFSLANFTIIEEYLSLIGWHIRKDEGMGIIACTGPSAAAQSLNLEETLSLLVLRLLFEEKQYDVTLHSELLVRQYEFHEKYKVLTDRILNKTKMRDVLHRLKMLKLIDPRGDETDPEALIVLYPSITFVLDSTTIDDVHQRIREITGTQNDDEELTDAEA